MWNLPKAKAWKKTGLLISAGKLPSSCLFTFHTRFYVKSNLVHDRSSKLLICLFQKKTLHSDFGQKNPLISTLCILREIEILIKSSTKKFWIRKKQPIYETHYFSRTILQLRFYVKSISILYSTLQCIVRIFFMLQ